MTECERIRPLLSRHHEGESSPDEAILVARHLPDCTACRIHLARERRLAEMLSNGLEDLPVDESFVHTVMATLPQGPPPRRKRRSGIKLACFAGLTGLVGLVGPQAYTAPLLALRLPGMPRLDSDAGLYSPEAWSGAVQVVATALRTIHAGSGISLPATGIAVAAIGIALVGALGIAATASVGMFCAARRFLA